MSLFGNNNQFSSSDVAPWELLEKDVKEYSSAKGYTNLDLDKNGIWRATDRSGQSVEPSREYAYDAVQFETAWDDFSSRDKGLDSWDGW